MRSLWSGVGGKVFQAARTHVHRSGGGKEQVRGTEQRQRPACLEQGEQGDSVVIWGWSQTMQSLSGNRKGLGFHPKWKEKPWEDLEQQNGMPFYRYTHWDPEAASRRAHVYEVSSQSVQTNIRPRSFSLVLGRSLGNKWSDPLWGLGGLTVLMAQPYSLPKPTCPSP